MNKKKIIGAIIAGVVIAGIPIGIFTCTSKIQPGYVGIQYSVNGGVKDEILSQGWKPHSPFVKVNKYSVATETDALSVKDDEGPKGDNSFSIPTSDGKTVNVDLEYSYHFDADRLPETFTRFKGQDGKTIQETFIRTKIKAWVGEVSSTFSVLDIYGEKRAQLNAAALEHVKNKFDEYGIIIDSVNFTRIGLDSQTEAAIQQRINKQQELEALKIEQEKAKVENETKIAKAEADAQAALISAQGQAQSNKELQQSITPELLKKMEMEARIKHGWIEVNGANTTVVKDKE